MRPFPLSEYLIPAIFALAALTTVAGALVAVMSTRIIRSVGGLMICCVGIAGLYYFLNSPFLALMEILIYVGAVCVTIVFGVMLSEPDEAPATNGNASSLGWGALALIVAALVTIGLSKLGLQGPWPAPPAKLVTDGSVAAIGHALLTTYALAFEVVSLVLLVAILGALVIARTGRRPMNAREVIAAAVGPALVAGPARHARDDRAAVPANGRPAGRVENHP